jgi:DnaJ-class molecular chaperone
MKGEGHDNVNRNTSNLIFKIVEHKHNNYVRKGNDLIYTQDISLEDALNSQSIQLTTLDNRILRIPID